MMFWILDWMFELLFGMLYPAYASFKAMKTKNTQEHVRWMMYWIVFSLFMTTENFTDLFISWFPFYYEVKMAFLVWLLSPYSRGASLLYRRCVHPMLASKEEDIDEFLAQVRERSCQTMLTFGKRGLSLAAATAIQAATTAIQTATMRQGMLAERLCSFSMEDLPPQRRTWLCLEDQELLGHGSGRRYESKTDNEESWSESSVFFSPSPLQDPKDQSRSQSLRNNVGKEGSSRLLRSHTRRKVIVSEQDS
ncbi:receptor expression-enhancing protein 4 isoform X2 [Prinia subflava]|uniref:receptor expression-enhancing protein 4 isoform X2 n=1 Tax=Prinia subflava TaxID=208062 RepID=UPI002FE10527